MDGQVNKQITKRRLKHQDDKTPEKFIKYFEVGILKTIKDIKGTKHLQECSLQHYLLLQKIGTQYSPIGKWTNTFK